MKSKTTLAYLLIFALLLIASILILHHAKNRHLVTKKDVINTFVTNGVFHTYDKNGRLNTKITAQHVTQYKRTQITYFTHPKILTFTKTHHTPWTIIAKHGKSNASGSHLFLWDNVVIHQLTASQKVNTTIKTSHLTIFPQTSQAKTDADVRIYQHGNYIHGKGLIANLKTGQYELLSQSYGTFNPNG